MQKNRFLVVLALLISVSAACSQTIAPSYEVGTWQGFRTAAVSFTFDDGCSNQFAIAIPMFNEFGFQLTLFTPTATSWLTPPDWTALNNAASQGHEVASHTITHTTFSGMSDSLQTMELRDSQEDINAHIPGGQCITMAYPYCASGKKSIVEKYYIAARTCGTSSSLPRTPSNFMDLSSIICGTEGSVKTTENFISKVGSAVTSKGWCVFLFHGIDNDGGWSPVPSTVLRETLEYLSANPNDYWVTSFGNVARYIKERNAASVAETSVQDSSITVQVTDTLDNAIFNHPVTIRRPLPAGWLSAAVTQNGASLESRIVDVNSVQTLQFDAIPDGGEVLITKRGDTGVETHGSRTVSSPALSQNYPNPFNPSTTIEFSLPVQSDVRLVLVNQAGQVVRELASGAFGAGAHQIQVDASSLPSGVYYYQLHAGNVIETQKLVLTK